MVGSFSDALLPYTRSFAYLYSYEWFRLRCASPRWLQQNALLALVHGRKRSSPIKSILPKAAGPERGTAGSPTTGEFGSFQGIN